MDKKSDFTFIKHIAENGGTETSTVKIPVMICAEARRYMYKFAIAEELLKMLAAHLQSR